MILIPPNLTSGGHVSVELDLDGSEWHDITCRLRGALTRWKALRGRQDQFLACLLASAENLNQTGTACKGNLQGRHFSDVGSHLLLLPAGRQEKTGQFTAYAQASSMCMLLLRLRQASQPMDALPSICKKQSSHRKGPSHLLQCHRPCKSRWARRPNVPLCSRFVCLKLLHCPAKHRHT